MAMVFEHTYVSYEFNAVVNMLRPARTLVHIRKLPRQPLS
jgi:hypothetical protein